jgi:hypothetical protein
VATVHNMIKKSVWVLPHPSVIFHAYSSADTSWVARTLSHCTPVKRGKVSSNLSTYKAIQFGDSICPICISTVQMLVQQGSTDAGLKRHRRGLPPWSSKFQIIPLSFLPIQYSPLSPNCPVHSPIMPTIRSSC